MDSLGIFLSHGHKYADMAKSLKASLLSLPSSKSLNVMLSEDMPAGKEWRKWIDDSVHAADVFVLLYPHTSMDMNWCNYEIGRFYQRDDNVVCIRNTNIAKSPPVFEPYQAIEGDRVGLTKFMEDLFAKGAWTNGAVLNPDVAKVTSQDRECVAKIAQELADKFSDARVDEQLYERRLVMSVKYASPGKLDPEQTIIEGNDDGMKLLGFNYLPGMKWSDIRNALATSHEWPMELEQAISKMGSGQLPPPLSPFRSPSGIFIPVIVRAEIVDRKLRQVFVIFVPADSDQLGALIEGSSLPSTMPATLKSLVQLLRLIFRARWDILEPRRAEARLKQPSRERCAEIVSQVLADYDELNGALAGLHLSGDDAFHGLFDRELWGEIDEGGKQWLDIVNGLRTKPPEDAEELCKVLSALRNNNAKWMNIGATQFSRAVAQFCKME
jgi:TIR domain-containing protein